MVIIAENVSPLMMEVTQYGMRECALAHVCSHRRLPKGDTRAECRPNGWETISDRKIDGLHFRKCHTSLPQCRKGNLTATLVICVPQHPLGRVERPQGIVILGSIIPEGTDGIVVIDIKPIKKE
jgi:hypothetical protein